MKPDFSKITYLRICLFDNATDEDLVHNRRKFKLTVGAKMAHSSDFMNFNFAMNTKGTWVINRGKLAEAGLHLDEHYKSLVRDYHNIKNNIPYDTDVPPRISKAYQSIAGSGKVAIPFVSAILWSTDGTYCVNLAMGDQKWVEDLSPHNLTAKERASGMIANTTWSTTQNGVFDWSKTSWV